MKLIIRAVGKLRDKRIQSLCDEYLERARRHLPVEVQEVAEDAGLVAGLPAGAQIIALDPAGDRPTTADLVRLLEQRMLQGTKALVFLIGGAEGLSPATRAAAHTRMSLSPLTLPHRIARLLLCEQLYRCLSDIRGAPYNK